MLNFDHKYHQLYISKNYKKLIENIDPNLTTFYIITFVFDILDKYWSQT